MHILKQASIPLNSLHDDIRLELWSDSQYTCSPICNRDVLQLAFNYTLYLVSHTTMKTLKNWTCAVAINSCYSFTSFPEMTWNSAVSYCSTLNMSLVTTPSDVEWNFISHLFAQHPDIVKLGIGMQLSYIGLLNIWVSVILSRHIDLVVC